MGKIRKNKIKMKILKVIILIVILNQMYFTEGKYVPSNMQYKEISDLRRQKTISEEAKTCLEICSECFNDVIFIIKKYTI